MMMSERMATLVAAGVLMLGLPAAAEPIGLQQAAGKPAPTIFRFERPSIAVGDVPDRLRRPEERRELLPGEERARAAPAPRVDGRPLEAAARRPSPDEALLEAAGLLPPTEVKRASAAVTSPPIPKPKPLQRAGTFQGATPVEVTDELRDGAGAALPVEAGTPTADELGAESAAAPMPQGATAVGEAPVDPPTSSGAEIPPVPMDSAPAAGATPRITLSEPAANADGGETRPWGAGAGLGGGILSVLGGLWWRRSRRSRPIATLSVHRVASTAHLNPHHAVAIVDIWQRGG